MRFARPAALLLAALLAAVSAAPAAAVGQGSLLLSGNTSGAVGVTQNVTVTVVDSGGMDPDGTTASFVANGAMFASGTMYFDGSMWNATVPWTPQAAGATVITAYWNGTASNPLTVAVASASTTTVVSSPSFAQQGTWVPVTITVASASGTSAPVGSVTLVSSTGFSQSLPLTPGAGAVSTATTQYYASGQGTVTLTATYLPASSGTTGSVSAPDTIAIGPAANMVSVTAPTTVTAGAPVAVTVATPAMTSGYLTLTGNGTPLVSGQKFSGGQATVTVTPAAVGPWQLVATVTSNAGQSYTGTDTINVIAPAVVDTITVSASGQGVLSTTAPLVVANGSLLTLQATSASGAPVSLSEAGPCVLTGVVLSVTTGSGQCVLSAVSPGGNGRSATSASYVVSLVPGAQTSPYVPAPSGTYRKGSSLQLAPESAVTNAGQALRWKVTSGKGCKVATWSGNMVLRVTKAGARCTVTGTAPAIPGQWDKYRVTRTYRSR